MSKRTFQDRDPRIPSDTAVRDNMRHNRANAEKYPSSRYAIESMFDAARLHGMHSKSEHEVGDLQIIGIALWLLLTESQRESAFQEDEIKSLLEDWGFTETT